MKNFVLRPDEYWQRLCDIELERLCQRGFRAILLDLDNTLVRWHSSDVSQENRCWLAEAQQCGMTICLVSNNRTGRVRRVAAGLGITCYAPAMKPFGRCYKRFQTDFCLKSSEIVVIGDQLFTDIWGGKRNDMYTILVEPLAGSEFLGTKVTRLMEYVYKWILWR